MENKPLRFGILGTGSGARNHLKAFWRMDPDVAVLRSVCGRDPDRTLAFAFQARAVDGIYFDQAAFLRDPDLDAVIIATPDAHHVPHALEAMRAGKHVLVEKPMSLSVADGRELRAAALAFSCRRLGIGFHMRHHAGHRLLRQKLAEGVIGRVLHVHIEWATASMGPDNWRDTSPDGRWFALAALGSHALDLAAWFFNAEKANVFATQNAATANGRDARATLHAEFPGQATASVFVSVVDRPTKFMRFVGSKGTVECRDTLGGRGGGDIVLSNQELIPFEPIDPYVAQLVEFAAAVRENRNPEADVEAGLRNVDWLVQASDSMNARVVG